MGDYNIFPKGMQAFPLKKLGVWRAGQSTEKKQYGQNALVFLEKKS
jgi:hypothetical protein